MRIALSSLLFVCVITACFTPRLEAQSGAGIGFIYGRHLDGLSVRYHSLQILFVRAGQSLNEDGDGFYIDASFRYNHPFRSWNRVKFKVFGQVGRESIIPEVGTVQRWRFTGGGSAEVPVTRYSGTKGLFLSLDVGLSIDHTGCGVPNSLGIRSSCPFLIHLPKATNNYC